MFGHQDGQDIIGQTGASQPVIGPLPNASLNDASAATIIHPATDPQPPTTAPPVAPSPAPPAEDKSKPAAEEKLPEARVPNSMQDTEDLLEIKEEALKQLSPLVNKLDQSPEEKFRTLMMMIQADDNQFLIKSAYEVAQQITDEKEKAQALLDIVNEINYFTQHPASTT